MSCNKCGGRIVRGVDKDIKSSVNCILCNKLFHMNCVGGDVNDAKLFNCDQCSTASSSSNAERITVTNLLKGDVNPPAVTFDLLYNEILRMDSANKTNFDKIFNKLNDFEKLSTKVQQLEAEVVDLKAVVNEN